MQPKPRVGTSGANSRLQYSSCGRSQQGHHGGTRFLDLRVEDDPEPLKELRRLVVLNQAYEHANRGDELMAKGKLTEAMEQYRLAAQQAPKNEELIFWEAVGLANNGRVPEAKKILKRVFKKNKDWKEVLSRLPSSGILSLEKDAMRDLLS